MKLQINLDNNNQMSSSQERQNMNCDKPVPSTPLTQLEKKEKKKQKKKDKKKQKKKDKIFLQAFLCDHCFKTSTGEKGLLKCGKCKVARYCNRECQKADWSTHKPRCANAKKLRDDGIKISGSKESYNRKMNWVRRTLAKYRKQMTWAQTIVSVGCMMEMVVFSEGEETTVLFSDIEKNGNLDLNLILFNGSRQEYGEMTVDPEELKKSESLGGYVKQ